MFELREYQKNRTAGTLEHGRNVFHEALADGGDYYHVHNPAGEDYDIAYTRNYDYYKAGMPDYVRHLELFPDYRNYDEDDAASLRLDFLCQYERFGCLHVNEYTIVLAHVILEYTDREVFFADARASWFFEPNARLHVGTLPQEKEPGTMLLVGPVGPTFWGPVTDSLGDIPAFHSVFTEQWFFDGLRREDIRYVSIPFDQNVGISAILGLTDRVKRVFAPLGLQVTYGGDRIGKFSLSELEKYFRLELTAKDAAEQNTLKMYNLAALQSAWLFAKTPARVTADIFTDSFRAALEEYHDGVIGNRKALGVLIRGTDYVTAGMGGMRRMATAEQMIPTIREWIDRDGYEVIFLATEDQNALERMREEFGDMLIAVAQERHTVEEFTDVRMISDLEKKLYEETEYDRRVMDTTVNYIYAIYLLSRCDGFIASGQCNGVDMVLSFNENRFENYYRFAVGEQ